MLSGELKNDQAKEGSWIWPVALVLGWAVLFLPALGLGELQLDAPMYAFFAKRVAATGEWLNLYYDWDGMRPYFNKPPGMFWMTAGLMKVFGQGVWVTRVAPAVLYLLAALAAQRAFRFQTDRLLAWSAAAILLTQREVLANVLECRMDAGMLVAVMVGSIGALRVMCGRGNGGGSGGGNGAGTVSGMALIGAAAGFGMMTRGWLALMVVPLSVLGILWSSERRALRSLAGWAALVGALGVVAGPWNLWQYSQWHDVMTKAVMRDTVGQNLEQSDRGVVFQATYFLSRVVELYAVWLLPAVGGAVVLYRRRKNLGPVDRLAVIWCVVYFVAIHFTPKRAPQYLLPIFPWLSYLAAIGLGEGVPAITHFWRRWWPGITVPLTAVILLVTMFGKGIGQQTSPELRRAATLMKREGGITGETGETGGAGGGEAAAETGGVAGAGQAAGSAGLSRGVSHGPEGIVSVRRGDTGGGGLRGDLSGRGKGRRALPRSRSGASGKDGIRKAAKRLPGAEEVRGGVGGREQFAAKEVNALRRNHLSWGEVSRANDALIGGGPMGL